MVFMRSISSNTIISALKPLILQANFVLDPHTLDALDKAQSRERSKTGLYVLGEIIDNAGIARREEMPLCQDTGTSCFFVKWGQECVLEGASLQHTFDEAVRQAYQEGFLRKSILRDPLFDRKNTGDNTPAYVHLEMVPGKTVEIEFLAKGSGCDNMSQMIMLKPSDGIEGVKKYVLKVCEEAGASSCPPWVIGIGVGGTFDTVTMLSKKAILREIGSRHKNLKYEALEEELLEEINALGIGPQGLGGKVTALAVFIESSPVHAASLPVAVCIQCHSNRKARVVIY